MEDDLQAGECSPLEPLILPPGVTPEIAARLTTGILMRRAYCSTTPWTQWLLLASVRILHGHGTPTLDSVNPRKLGILTTKWVQVKGPRLTEVGVQADALPSYEIERAENFDAQIAVSGCAGPLPQSIC
ncbi:hypothetical protein O3P69_001181 [Scylla paramamosain]|uniref:Uncharacterized protein n=1 Tax=Scylla paramamosain TaxID=85552 RepID=A0AAW0URP8_SCYPA